MNHPTDWSRWRRATAMLCGLLAGAAVMASAQGYEPTVPTVYTGEKLSLNFQGIDTRALLQVIADFTQLNIVASESVTGQVTLRLHEVPWDQALDIVLRTRGLGMRRMGNVIWVAPQVEILAKEREELAVRQAIRTLEPVRTEHFRLHFAKASDIAAQLSTAIGQGDAQTRVLSRQGSVFAEPRTNQLFVTDIPSKLLEIRQLIQQLDIPVRQVLIEARIVEATESFGRLLGVRLGGRISEPVTLAKSQGNALEASLAFSALGSTSALDTRVSAIPSRSAAVAHSVYTVSLFNPAMSRLLNLELAASQSDGTTRVMASPRVVTADQKEARIEDGQKIPIQTGKDDKGLPTYALQAASLLLVVTPQITPDGDVVMKIEAKNDSPTEAPDGQNAIETKSVQTEVLVQNGGTLLIGGIFLKRQRRELQSVPLLADLPVVGHLFKNQSDASTQRELLIFITPRILSDSHTPTGVR
jgi:type IV pilus assembly protein PilQ